MTAVTTSIDSSTGGVKILWVSPNSNSDTITAYKIEIYNPITTNWNEDLTNCDGTNSGVISNLYCVIPMSTFLSTYGYSYGLLVEVRASAQNTYGWGPVSTTNTVGATILTVPVQMTAPVRGSGTTISQIQVDWTALTTTADQGGSTILSYHLQWDSGTSGVTWTDLIGLSVEQTATTYTVTSGITGGQFY